jgi:hypothetical protein
MAIAELIQQICSISMTKAQRVVESVCSSSNWVKLRDVSAIDLQNAGLTEKQTVRLLAALEVGKRAYTTKKAKDNIDGNLMCLYNTPNSNLRCAINPVEPCDHCTDFEEVVKFLD